MVAVENAQGQGFVEPGATSEQAAVQFVSPPEVPQTPIAAVVERAKAELFKIQGVHGVAVGRGPIGDDAIRVDVEDEAVAQRIPNEIEGYAVEVVIVPGGFGILPAGSRHTG